MAVVLGAFLVTVGAGRRIYVVHTGSMTPTIPPRSAVVVAPHSYHLGQVITFTENGVVVSHRFVGINPDGTLITKGDANTTVDPWHTTRADVIGGVVAAPRQLGYWLVYLRKPAGIGSIAGGVLCVYLIWSISASVLAEDAETRTSAVDDAPAVGRPGAHRFPDVPERRHARSRRIAGLAA